MVRGTPPQLKGGDAEYPLQPQWRDRAAIHARSLEHCHKRQVCLSKLKSEHIRGAIRRGLGGKEWALPSYGARQGRVLIQGQVRARLIIVASVRFQNAAQMHLAQDNDVVQTLPADRSDQPFGEAVLPG